MSGVYPELVSLSEEAVCNSAALLCFKRLLSKIQCFRCLLGHDVVEDNQGSMEEEEVLQGVPISSTLFHVKTLFLFALTSTTNCLDLLPSGYRLPGPLPSLTASHVRWHVMPWTTARAPSRDRKRFADAIGDPHGRPSGPGVCRRRAGPSGNRGPGVAL